MPIVPDSSTFIDKSRKGGLVPISLEVIADLDTPLTLFSRIQKESSHCFLFESMQGGEKWGRFSFIGFDPLVTFTSQGEQIHINEFFNGTAKEKDFSGDALEALQELLASCRAQVAPELPRFSGGAVGFLGYDMVRFMEELPSSKPQHDLPDSSFMIPRFILAHDNFKQTLTIICWVRVDDGDAAVLYKESVQEVERIAALLRKPVDDSLFTDSAKGYPAHEFTSNFKKEEFEAMVEKAREYILQGDIIQVVLSQCFHTITKLSPMVLYRALRHINPSPYLFYLQMGDILQIGSSPEILVRKEGREIYLRPIAGTRKRGATLKEDLALEKELLADPKEIAEHMMLVDLGRNDVGRVAKPGQVWMDDLLVIERYSHVMHIVSGVRGEIADGLDQFDVLKASFPAGTVSGAPKIRAMQIIDELEPDRRGPYAGSVGYFGFSDNMDFCITIRTFVMKGEDLWIQAGAGIVADSVAEKEYEETVNKSLGLRRAVELAERGF
ncbi:MAG: anthranilate synthase component I [Desulforhopalus sp.]|nr:anthranilate synthase component I [Desulforhopalus sp.]